MKDPMGLSTSEVLARLSRNPAFADRWALEEPKGILAANVAKLRHERGLTQLDLATIANMKQPRIAEIESGEANPKLETIARIATALGVSVSDLFADGEQRPSVNYEVSVQREVHPFAVEEWWPAGRSDRYAEVRKQAAANDAFALTA